MLRCWIRSSKKALGSFSHPVAFRRYLSHDLMVLMSFKNGFGWVTSLDCMMINNTISTTCGSQSSNQHKVLHDLSSMYLTSFTAAVAVGTHGRLKSPPVMSTCSHIWIGWCSSMIAMVRMLCCWSWVGNKDLIRCMEVCRMHRWNMHICNLQDEESYVHWMPNDIRMIDASWCKNTFSC